MIDLKYILKQAELRERGEPSALTLDHAVMLSYFVIALVKRLQLLIPGDICPVCAGETFTRPGPKNQPDWERRRCSTCDHVRLEPEEKAGEE